MRDHRSGEKEGDQRGALSFYQVLIEQHRELHEQHPEWKK